MTCTDPPPPLVNNDRSLKSVILLFVYWYDHKCGLLQGRIS